MRSFAAIAGFVAAANAWAYNYTAPPTYETTVVSEYTTVCPGPTEIPIGPGKTITVTESTTLTITNCPVRRFARQTRDRQLLYLVWNLDKRGFKHGRQ